MRIIAASDIESGSHRAHAINVVKTAGGFARLGHEVRVLWRGGSTSADESARAYAEPSLRWESAPPGARGADRAETFGAWVRARASAIEADLVYARHFDAALACAEAGLRTVLETHAHAGDPNPALAAACRATAQPHARVDAIVTISPTLRDYYVTLGADPASVHIVPDGVDLDLFAPPGVLGPCPWPANHARNAVYAGHLYDYKGIPAILGAAALLPDVVFHLVGGTPEDLERTRARSMALGNVVLHGPRAHADVAPFLWHADVLLLPPSAREASAAWTSPVKLGEYLAAGPPIIASDIPGLRAWIHEPAAMFFRADDPGDLARAIRARLAEDPDDARRRRALAASLARRYSYPERARAILRAASVGPVARPPALTPPAR